MKRTSRNTTQGHPKIKTPRLPRSISRAARYSLLKGLARGDLTSAGEHTDLRHEQGANGQRPRYSLRKELGFWRLTFGGQQAIFKHERGATYVAYLLLNPPEEPIHALDLCTRLSRPERKGPGIRHHVLIASGRCCAKGGPRPSRGAAGCFTYRPPKGIVWGG
jgi:hypothetical protein